MHRYLFWTEPTAKFIKRLNLATKNTVKFPSQEFGEAYTLIVDYAYGRTFWLQKNIPSNVSYIWSSDFRGKHQKYISSGSLNTLMGVIGDLLYFQNKDLLYIKEINVSNREISRNIQLPEKYSDYQNLIIVQNAHRIRTRGKLYNNDNYC